MDCFDTGDSSTFTANAFFTVIADTAVSKGASTSLQDWYILIGSSPTYNIGTGVFLEPDYGQSYTLTNTSMPAWLTFSSVTKTFTAAGATNILPFSAYHLTVTLTATDSANTPNTAT